jgi:hypothetical protein
MAAGYNRNQLHNAGSTLGLTGSVWSLADLKFPEREVSLAV